MQKIAEFIKELYGNQEFTPLHAPYFGGREKEYLNECIDSTFVSSVGAFVDRFEKEFAAKVGSKYAIATVNGTAALHIALLLGGVESGDEVITQPLTFVATCNAISYCGAAPVFVDVDSDTMGLSPLALSDFLQHNCEIKNGFCINKKTKKTIKACIPMHTLGHPCRIDEIKRICNEWHIALIEDAAESLGSYYKGRHTGSFGLLGAFSFNGNKIVTSGGGGVIVTDSEALAKRAKHITTTAKVPHRWEFVHDEVGYNYRLPNINAALLVAQLEQLDGFLQNKRATAKSYEEFFGSCDGIEFVKEPKNAKSNYWLNTLLFQNKAQKEHFLALSNDGGVMTRPLWRLMNSLEAFKDAQCEGIPNAIMLEERAVNIPSGVRV